MLNKTVASILVVIIAQLITFITLPIIGNNIGSEAFGEYSSVVSIGSFIGTLIFFRSELGIVNNDEKESYNVVNFCLLFLFIIFFFLTVFVAMSIPVSIALFSISLFANTVCINFLTNRGEYIYSSFLKLFISIAFFSIFLWLNKKVDVSILHSLSMLVPSLVVILFFYERRHYSRLSMSLFVKSSKRFWIYTAPSSFFSSIMLYSLPIMIGFIFGKTSLGIFFMMYKILMAPITLVGFSVGQILRKEFSIIKNNHELLRDKFNKVIFMLFFSSVIYTSFVVLGLEMFIRECMSAEWLGVVHIYKYYLILPAVLIIYVPISQLYLALEKQNVDLVFQIVSVTILSFLFFLGVKNYIDFQDFVFYYAISNALIYLVSILYLFKKANES